MRDEPVNVTPDESSDFSIYCFLLGHDFMNLLKECDGTPAAVNRLVEEGRKYSTGEKPFPDCIRLKEPFRFRPDTFRKAVVWALNAYWGHRIGKAERVIEI